ncbi:hypothetical protein JCM10450v2_003965 [Rhodotorula kratochvilovae]
MLARDAVLLPSELWDHVLSLVEPALQQHTALALSRALPRAHISSAAFLRHLRISRPGQAIQASHHLRHSPQGTATAVKTATVEVWRDDPQLIVNLLLSLPDPRSIALTVGPLAAPEHLEDLLDPAGIRRTARWKTLEQLAFRFNPYCSERSYYTFLKGAYFDTAPLSLARTSPEHLPALRRLSFIQDLPPTYGTVQQETPAFGLHQLADALDDAAAAPAPAPASAVVPVSGKFGRVLKKDKMDFAQPIVFFQLGCLTRLSTSPLAAQLTHLTFRLPRRAILPSLTSAPPGAGASFPALRHLDLSTTHVVDDARVPTLLRLHPALETLVLDRCSGLVGRDAVDEPTALATLRWLGKCCASPPLLRAEEALRSWRQLSKARPTDAPTPSGSGTPIPPVRDLLPLPPPPALRSLGLGLHPLSARVARAWTQAFGEGYADGAARAGEKARDVRERWDRWARTGKLAERARRVVLFADAVPAELRGAVDAAVAGAQGEGEAAEDPLFARFCAQRGLVALPAECDPSLVRALVSAACDAYAAAEAAFVLCLTADCTDRPGRPHLTLSAAGTPATLGESVEERREREKRAWEAEREEEAAEGGWRRPEGEHREGCAHLEGRRAWALD